MHPDEVFALAKPLYDEGASIYRRGNYAAAIIPFQECLNLYIKHQQANSFQAATCHYSLGLSYQKSNMMQEALNHFFQSSEIYTKIKGAASEEAGKARKKIAEVSELINNNSAIKGDSPSLSFEKIKQSADLSSLFFNAIENDDAKTVSYCLQQGVDPNSKFGSKGFTNYLAQTVDISNPLFSAASKGKTIATLMPFFSNSQGNIKFGENPLYFAARKGHANIIKILLDNHSSIDQPENGGLTPLHIAVQEGHQSVVELLLQRGAKPNQQANDGSTALFFAIESNNKNMAKLLLDWQANPNHVDNDGEFPLLVAALRGFTELAELLMSRGANVNQSKDNGVTALFVAAQGGHVGIMKLLLSRNASVDITRVSDAITPLHVAACGGHLKAVELLIQNGAIITRCCKDNRTALDYARINRCSNVANMIENKLKELRDTSHLKRSIP